MERQLIVEGRRVACRPAASADAILFQSVAGWLFSLPGGTGSAHKDTQSGVVYVQTPKGSWALEKGRAHRASIPKGARFMGVVG